jgi:hypothetical protein
MKSFFYIFLLAIISLTLPGCANARLGPGLRQGIIFSCYKGPLYCNTKAPDGVPVYNEQKSNQVATHKIVLPYPQNFGILSAGIGDMSLARALAEGKLTEIDYMEYELITVLNIYTRASIIIYGR